MDLEDHFYELKEAGETMQAIIRQHCLYNGNRSDDADSFYEDLLAWSCSAYERLEIFVDKMEEDLKRAKKRIKKLQSD